MKTPQDPKKLEQLSDKLYKKYAKPLEKEHWGEFLAVSQRGEIILGDNMYEVIRKASDAFGPENFVYKVGDIAVGKGLLKMDFGRWFNKTCCEFFRHC